MRFGLALQLILFATILVVSSVMVSTFLAYQNSKKQLEQSLSSELLVLVNSTVPFISARRHDDIVRIDEDFVDGMDNFKRIRQVLLAVKNSNGLKKSAHGSPLYTLRKSFDFDETGMLEFVTMTDKNDEGIYFIGYQIKAEPHHLKALQGESAVTEIYSDSEGDWISSVAPIFDKNKNVVGILQADRHVSFFYKEVAKVAIDLLVGAIFTILAAIIIAMLYSRNLVKPVNKIVEAATSFGKGNYDKKVNIKRSDEIGFLGITFNKMSLRIKQSQAKELKQKLVLQKLSKALANANKGLEERVKSRTAQLEESNGKLGETLKSLQESQASLMQSEKMASLGQLAAGVAHEINNPMAFISSNMKTLEEYVTSIMSVLGKAQPLIEAAKQENKELIDESINAYMEAYQQEDVDFLVEDAATLLTESIDGANRVKDIVTNLKGFSHVDNEGMKNANLNEAIESTLKIAHNETKYNCEVVTKFGDIPEIMCDPGKLNQVFLNLVVNAAHAIEEEGTITVSTEFDDTHVIVKVADTGKGIAKENLDKLYEAFFTTKAVGQGTGLGLYIAYGIIEDHKGEIIVDSEVGVGTTFTIKLPIVLEVEKAS